MDKLQKVISGLEHCLKYDMTGKECHKCPYSDECGTDGEPMMRDAVDLLKEHRWVSIEERLPGPFEVVLISILSRNGYGEPARIESIGCWEHGKWKCFVSGFCEGECVTHWMPMPKGPFESR